MREKKNLRRVTLLVTAQTAYNLDRLAAMCGYREPGHVVDKLVREKILPQCSYISGTPRTE